MPGEIIATMVSEGYSQLTSTLNLVTLMPCATCLRDLTKAANGDVVIMDAHHVRINLDANKWHFIKVGAILNIYELEIRIPCGVDVATPPVEDQLSHY